MRLGNAQEDSADRSRVDFPPDGIDQRKGSAAAPYGSGWMPASADMAGRSMTQNSKREASVAMAGTEKNDWQSSTSVSAGREHGGGRLSCHGEDGDRRGSRPDTATGTRTEFEQQHQQLDIDKQLYELCTVEDVRRDDGGRFGPTWQLQGRLQAVEEAAPEVAEGGERAAPKCAAGSASIQGEVAAGDRSQHDESQEHVGLLARS